MLDNLPYLKWQIIFMFIPSLVVWVLAWDVLKHYKKTILVITAIGVVWGVVFNVVSSSWLHIWFYQNHLGVSFLGLPLEEYITLLVMPQQFICILLVIRKYYGKT